MDLFEQKSMEKVGIIYGDVGTTQVQFTVVSSIDQGEYVQIKHQTVGWVLGRIDTIERKTDLSSVRALEMSNGGNVPIQETIVGTITIIGYRDDAGILQYPKTPFFAGTEIYKAQDSVIKKVIGIETIKKTGAFIGKLYNHDIPIYLDINSLIQKHVSILSKTGGGKSYLTGVILEELLKHNVTAVVIDPHGEYSSIKSPSKNSEQLKKYDLDPKGFDSDLLVFSPDTSVNKDSKPLKFTLFQMNSRELLTLMNLADYRPYLVPLRKAIDRLKLSKIEYGVEDIIRVLEEEEESATVNVLVNALTYLNEIGIFEKKGTKIDEIVQKGKLSIINLRGVPPDIQELVTQRLSFALFELRKRDKIPPLMLVVEECHNFVPQQGKALSSKILRTIASEGRKFGLGLCLISQRPAKVDKNVLSQCNTQIILKVTNPNDLKAIGSSVEGLTKGSLEEIQRLPVGVALVMGGSLNMPLFVEIRPRQSKHGGESVNIVG